MLKEDIALYLKVAKCKQSSTLTSTGKIQNIKSLLLYKLPKSKRIKI
jgi:hypothetical protein